MLNSYPHNTDTLLYQIDVFRLDIPGADELSTHRSRKLLTGTVNKCIPWIASDVFRFFTSSQIIGTSLYSHDNYKYDLIENRR